MVLEVLITDLLSLVTRLLTYEDLNRLRMTTPTMKRRLELENCIHEVTITREDANLSSLACLGRTLVKLLIQLNYELPRTHEFAPGVAWVLSLPETLLEIDFKFRACAGIWLEENTSNSLPWPFTTTMYPYAPIYMCKRFPRLRRLILDCSNFANPFPSSKTRFGLDTIAEDLWNDPMIELFIKKLPRDLETLVLPTLGRTGFASLPPQLVHLKAVTHCKNQFERQNKVPDSLMESLKILEVADLDDSEIHLWTQFPHLSTLHISHIWIHGIISDDPGMFKSFPRSLTSLKLIQGITNRLAWNDLALLPRSLTSLDLEEFASGAPQYPSNVLLKPGDHWAVLPPTLTSLKILFHRNDVVWPTLLSGICQSLHYLKKLWIGTLVTHVEVKDFEWVPCSTLQSLSVVACWRPSTLLKWPRHVPNNIEHLFLHNYGADTVSEAEILRIMPRNLTSLYLSPSAGLSESFLSVCPRSLTSIDLFHDNSITRIPDARKHCCWDISKLREIRPQLRPTNLIQLRVLVSITSMKLPSEMTLLSESTLATALQSPENMIPGLNAASCLDLFKWDSQDIHHLPAMLPSSITSITLPIALAPQYSAWKSLPNLTALHIESWQLVSLGSTNIRLKTFSVQNITPSSRRIPFEHEIFELIEEVAMPCNFDGPVFPCILAHLKHLKLRPRDHIAGFNESFRVIDSLLQPNLSPALLELVLEGPCTISHSMIMQLRSTHPDLIVYDSERAILKKTSFLNPPSSLTTAEIALLPRHLVSMELKTWVFGMCEFLPTSLLSLVVHNVAQSALTECSSLPQTLETLSLTLHFRSRPPSELFDDLPRKLKHFSLGVEMTPLKFDSILLRKLPETLESLRLPRFKLKLQRPILDYMSNLSWLEVAEVAESSIGHLPPSLTVLMCALNPSLETLQRLSERLPRLTNEQFFVPNEPHEPFWILPSVEPFWRLKLEHL